MFVYSNLVFFLSVCVCLFQSESPNLLALVVSVDFELYGSTGIIVSYWEFVFSSRGILVVLKAYLGL